MNIETAITIVAILGTYIVLVCCIRGLMKQNAILHQLLRETTREYKMYQASANEDYKTAGILRNGFAGDKQPALEPEEDTVTETIVTQHG